MPFLDGGEIDEASLRREVDWVISSGVDGLGLGLASELPRLTEDERDHVIKTVVTQVRGRVDVVASVSAESTNATVAYARAAEAAGATALMIRPPSFDIHGRGVQYEFFRAVAKETRALLVLQDTPQARVDFEVASRLARDLPGRLTLKIETPPTPGSVAEAVRTTGGTVPILGGAGGVYFYSELLRGAAGTMPGSVIPEFFVRVWSSFRSGDFPLARSTFARMLPFLTATDGHGSMLAYYRAGLQLRGIFGSSAARFPGMPLDATDKLELHDLLSELGVAVVDSDESLQSYETAPTSQTAT